MIPWWLASLVANVSIISTEYWNRTHPGSWFHALPVTAPLILIAQFCLWRSFSSASSLMLAWSVFTLGNAGMRVAMVALGLGGEIANWFLVLAGVGVMILGSLVLKQGLA